MNSTIPNKLNLNDFNVLNQVLSRNSGAAKNVQCPKEQSNGIAETGSRFTDNIKSTKNVSDTAPSRFAAFAATVKKTITSMINSVLRICSIQREKTVAHTTDLATISSISRHVDNTSQKLPPSSTASPSVDYDIEFSTDSDYDLIDQYQSPQVVPLKSSSEVAETQSKNMNEKKDDEAIYSVPNKAMEKTEGSPYSNKISTSKGEWSDYRDEDDTPPPIPVKTPESYKIPREYMQDAYTDRSTGIEEPIFGNLQRGK